MDAFPGADLHQFLAAIFAEPHADGCGILQRQAVPAGFQAAHSQDIIADLPVSGIPDIDRKSVV